MSKLDLFDDLAKDGYYCRMFLKLWDLPSESEQRQIFNQIIELNQDGLISLTKTGSGPGGKGMYAKGRFTLQGIEAIRERKLWEV